MIIDSNIYWLDEEIFNPDSSLGSAFLEELNALPGCRGVKKTRDDGRVLFSMEEPAGYQNLNYLQGEYKLDQILSDMDAAGVDTGLMKMPGCSEWISLDTFKVFNNGMAKAQKDSKQSR